MKAHNHLDTKEKLYFLLGIIDPQGNIIQNNILSEVEYKQIINKIKNCNECFRVAKIHFDYNLINSEDYPYIEERKNSSQNLKSKLLLQLILMFFLIFIIDYDHLSSNQSKNLSLAINNQVLHSKEIIKETAKIQILKNKQKIGYIYVNSDSSIKIKNRKICKTIAVELIKGGLEIELNKNIPFCVVIEDKIFFVKNVNQEKNIYLTITKNIEKEDQIGYEFNLIKGNSDILILPDYQEYTLNEEEVLIM